MITTAEVQAIADALAPGIVAEVRVHHEPTYEMDGDTHALDADKRHVPRLDANGEHTRHPVESVHLILGRVSCSFDLAHGPGSAHVRARRERAEIEGLIRRQVANLMLEATRKPLTPDEHRAWEHEQARRAAAIAAESRATHETQRRAALTADDRAHEDYVAEHGEPDYDRHVTAAGDPLALVGHAVRIGALSEDAGRIEAERLTAWRDRSATRKAK